MSEITHQTALHTGDPGSQNTTHLNNTGTKTQQNVFFRLTFTQSTWS